ncbi:MAG TPA: hypothetical protein PKE40_03005 [Arachnia sp.]|nr:hypothetical protein [Arachnia sp.]
MTERDGTTRIVPLTRTPSGISAPRYADGQVVHAADLRLDRSSHDEELQRMRRLLHGWGVVAGLTVTTSEATIVVHPGYGVCPSGAEVLLPRAIPIEDLPAKMTAACLPGSGQDCGLDPPPEGDEGPLRAWLVIRSVATEAAPRATLSDPCLHPGNQLAPTRVCVDDVLGLTCRLPDGHEREPWDCDAARAHLDGITHQGWPIPIPDDDFLVLAALTWSEGILEVSLEPRRPLLPVSVLQDIVQACADARASGGGDGPEPPVDGGDHPPVDREPKPGPNRRDWVGILRLARDRTLLIPKPGKPDLLGPVAQDEVIRIMVDAGLSTSRVLAADAAEIVELTGLAPDVVDTLKGQLASVAQHVGGMRF